MNRGPWNLPPARIRIVQRPEGEAPEWVRDAWIGLELPLLHPEPVESFGFGVVSGPRNVLSEWLFNLMGRARPVGGYLVAADEAVALLSGRNPEAAGWWRREAAYLVRPGAQFLFDAPACERIG